MLLVGSKSTGSVAIGALVLAYLGVPGSTLGGVPGAGGAPGSSCGRSRSGAARLAAAGPCDPLTSRPAPEAPGSPAVSRELALGAEARSSGSPPLLRQPPSAPRVAVRAHRTRSS